MKSLLSIYAFLLVGLLAASAAAERLELGLAMTSNWMTDEHYEAFSEDNLYAGRFGLDVRVEVANLSGFKIIPLLGYRYSHDSGDMFWSLSTDLNSHDFNLGVRVRKGLFPWMALFAEVTGGVLVAAMTGELQDESSYGYSSTVEPLHQYEDRAVTWAVGAMAGVEFTMSRSRLRRRGISHFCFGGEISGGYVRRGDLSFEPTLGGGDAFAIDSTSVGSWGAFNLSGGVAQLAFNFYFL